MCAKKLTAENPAFYATCIPFYHIIHPSSAQPSLHGFAYSWLELISHRVFIAKLLLQTPQQICACVVSFVVPFKSFVVSFKRYNKLPLKGTTNLQRIHTWICHEYCTVLCAFK
jgi:hypothetical protein